VNRSMSIRIEDLRRMAGSIASILRAVVGLGGPVCCTRSWVSRVGRSNDQDLTRSNARAWHPTERITINNVIEAVIRAAHPSE
jgi:hypothetical protein